MKYPFPENKTLQGLTVAFILIMLMLVSFWVVTTVFRLTLPLFFDVADANAFMLSTQDQIANPMASLYMQMLLSPLGLFLLPALAFHYMFRIDIPARLKLRTAPSLKYWLVAIIVMMAAGVFIQLLVQLMQQIHLPPKLQSLRASADLLQKLVDSFFTQRSPFHFVILTLCIAVLPACAEEIFFRGTVMNILRDFSFTPVAAILISGFVFAVMHFEFDNVLGIWCMGIVLGMLYFYTDSLWVAITAHFFNNFSVVAGKYAFMSGSIHSDLTSSEALPLYYTIPAGIIMVGGLVILSKWSGKKVTALPN
ncbi:MAG: putative metal-dependent rane protease [Bacteroidetes bacterium]|nr:putative metal-dependent rane protease [Bacteroidota bacterium]